MSVILPRHDQPNIAKSQTSVVNLHFIGVYYGLIIQLLFQPASSPSHELFKITAETCEALPA